MELQITDLFKMVKQRFFLILGLTCIAVAATGWISFYVLAPKYQATTTLLVQPKDINHISYDDLIANEKLGPTFGLIVKSKRIAADVIYRLRLDMSEEDLLKNVEVTGVRNSLVTKISVTHPDPAQAVAIANGFAESFKGVLPDIMNVGTISILDGAELEGNAKPISPKPVFNMVVVFLLALNLGIGIAILAEVLDKTVKSEEVLANLLKIPVLATIAKYSGKNAKLKGRILCLEEPKSFIAEAFRKLRTNIRYMKANREIKTLLITSALPKEGKTFAAANLAVALAQEGKRVLLMDCNLRAPSLCTIFNVPSEQGLTGALMNEICLEEAIFSTAQDNLDFLPSGPVPPNPSELLGTPEMAELLESLRQRYDMILLDSPSVIPVTDTQVLAKLSDAVLLITKLGGTFCKSALQAKNLLEHVGANVIGTVANYKKMKDRIHYPYLQKEIANTHLASPSIKKQANCS